MNVRKASAAYAAYVPIADIDVHDIRQMYSIFSFYYENTSWDIFLSDLSKKTGALVLRNNVDRIVGFSTIMVCDVAIGGRSIHGVFSGDTIIERAYWGSRVLQKAFYRFMAAEKARYPLQAVYWFLISKGYKTYLLMANNLFNYYPRPDGDDDPYLRDIVDAYCEEFFPDYYQKEKGIIDFGRNYQPLKGDVSVITDQMRKDSQAIRLFEARNPEWFRGTEMPCVAEVGWSDIAKFGLRFLRKPVSKGRLEVMQKQPKEEVLAQVIALRSAAD